MKTFLAASAFVLPLWLSLLTSPMQPRAAAAQQNTSIVRRDSRPTTRSLVFCIDRSLSPSGDQFSKLLAVMEMFSDKDVTFGDLVWLVEIQGPGTMGPVQAFGMPAGSSRRSDGTAASDQLQKSKAALRAAIHKMSQVSGSTDLRNSVGTALDLLNAYPGVADRTLVVGSDFLTDIPKGPVTMDPPKTSPNRDAAGVKVLLLITTPKPSYLQNLGVSSIDLIQGVRAKWSTYFMDRGALDVQVISVDAAAATIQPGAGSAGKIGGIK